MFFSTETAGLLPAKYFKQRYKLAWDVRENLFEHQKDLTQVKNTKKTGGKKSNKNGFDMEGYQADQPYMSNEITPTETLEDEAIANE